MEQIVNFLTFLESMLRAALWITIVVGIIVTGIGIYRRSWYFGVAGLLIGTSFFIFAAIGNFSTASEASQRRAVVSAMVTERLPSNYPATLVIDGNFPIGDIPELMSTTQIDRVLHLERRASWIGPNRSPECVDYFDRRNRELAGIRETIERPSSNTMVIAVVNGAMSLRSSPACGPSIGPVDASGDRLILRIGSQVRRRSAGGYVPKGVEIELVRNGRAALIHYDEMLDLGQAERATRIGGPSYRYACYDFDYLQIMRNVIAANNDPARAEVLMTRPRDPSRCVVSVEPFVAETAADEIRAHDRFRRQQIARIRRDRGLPPLQ